MLYDRSQRQGLVCSWRLINKLRSRPPFPLPFKNSPILSIGQLETAERYPTPCLTKPSSQRTLTPSSTKYPPWKPPLKFVATSLITQVLPTPPVSSSPTAHPSA